MHGFVEKAAAACLVLFPALAAHAQPASADSVPTSMYGTLEAHGEQRSGIWLPVYGGGSPSFRTENVVFKPWAQGLFDARQRHDLEPHARCKPSGAVRQFLTPYGVEIVEIDELKRLYIFDIGGPHSFREVFMDGRSHPANLSPTYYGHNIGWWEGDTLVVDSVGYNEGFWFERMGLPHTEAVHVTEYFKRVDANNVEYRFVMEDETAYDTPVEGQMRLSWREGEELFEYVCQQSNYADQLMVNPDDPDAVRTSVIVP
jgi:hypothetical protein